MKNVSVVGKGYHTEEKVTVFYNADDRIKMWGKRGAMWGGLWSLFFGGLFLTIPLVGHVISRLRGPIARILRLAEPRGMTVLRVPARRGVALSILLLLAGLAVHPRAAAAAQAVQTFGPGQVNCQALTGTRVDCLLGASRVARDNRNVATFSIAALPHGDQALFRKWCLRTADECTVTVTGRRDSPQSSRLSTVTTIRWTRLSAPMDQAEARTAEKASAEPMGVSMRPAP